MLIHEVGAKNPVCADLLEAASYQGGDIVLKGAAYNSQLTGRKPGQWPPPQVACRGSQGVHVTAFQGIGNSVIYDSLLICNVCY